ncbi:MAG: hypothetical protein ED557_08295 [Balneola sp.]|nr:MAG: hypothetical protein ED557_08295 [Balneola sp.]
MQIYEAENWFSKLNFQRDEDWDLHPKSVYTCPKCNKSLRFSFKDFDKHTTSSYSNLSDSDNQEFKSYGRKGCNSFLDFYCQKCKSPTKVFFNFWSGGRYTYGFEIKFVGLLR